MIKLNEVFNLAEAPGSDFDREVSRKAAHVVQQNPDVKLPTAQQLPFGLIEMQKAVGGAGKDQTHSYDLIVYPRIAQINEPVNVIVGMGAISSKFGKEAIRSNKRTTLFYKWLAGDQLEPVDQTEFQRLATAWEKNVGRQVVAAPQAIKGVA